MPTLPHSASATMPSIDQNSEPYQTPVSTSSAFGNFIAKENGTLSNAHVNGDNNSEVADFENSALLHRNIHQVPRHVTRSQGATLHLANGVDLLDASCGAAVSCLGHQNERVVQAIIKQMSSVSYCLSTTLGNTAAEDLAAELMRGTGGLLQKAYICGSGSEAMDAAIKLTRQYFLELSPPQPKRINFIARRQSYHGATLGALSLGYNAERRALFEPMLMTNCSHVSPCYAYRGIKDGEPEAEYVKKLIEELDDEFQRLGPDTVCAFVMEPVVGATLGCVPSVPGYLPAVKQVCEKYGALLILDEVMCGMGRSGVLHAWQEEMVVPDIQTIGKGLGGGFLPIAGVLIGAKVTDTLYAGSGAFQHGHTYQGHAVICAAALEVQKQIREEGLVEQCKRLGHQLELRLKERLTSHRYVGDIRGKGLFWGIEFVQNKVTKEPFAPMHQVAGNIHEKGLSKPYSISLYPGTKTMGDKGDAIIVSPPYTSTPEMIEDIVDRTARVINDYFNDLDLEIGTKS